MAGLGATGLNDIRTAFLDYFRAHDHEVAASGSLVPADDPTLLFTNSGMVQFKPVFTGARSAPWPRAVTAQKCVRAGGKHNDLDNVGHTTRHHTFFEMLGNFSFGDYFKAGAIELAWRLLTREFGLPPERLLVTVFSADDDAFGLWRKVSGLPESRILRISTSDNFWSMGETGPCGPCSEIFYDHGAEVSGGPPGSAAEDGERFVEIWNLVFMQFEQKGPSERVDLPSPCIDTGLGLERMTAVLQGVRDNYATDLMRALILASAEASGTDPDGAHAVSHRVMADHLRAAAFLVADGVLPSNERRGYVLRRIMRRAMRHACLLGMEEPLMWRLVPELVAQMGRAYPELERARSLITETLKLEESRFRETLARGLKLLDEEIAALGAGRMLSGETAFRLYDTYGFPLDLTQDAVRARGLGVDMAGFEAAMARQKQAARAHWAGSGGQAVEQVWLDLRDRLGPTEFLGYGTDDAGGQVLALVADGAPVEEAVASGGGEGTADICVVLNQTPFYGESGGQVGDTGVLLGPGLVFQVTDTQRRAADVIVHRGVVREGVLRRGAQVTARVDAARRDAARANHSATHLLHEALRRVLGGHVTQKGSLVAPDRLRFDFSHLRPMTPEEIAAVEDMVNAQVRGNHAVETRIMTPEAALEAGALALFGEKYGGTVRVLFMGADAKAAGAAGGVAGGAAGGAAHSVEFCGGTHVRRLGDIAVFKIVSESGVAAGVRRVEALTGAAALRHLVSRGALGDAAAALLKVPLEGAPDRIKALLEERRRLERELEQARKALALGGGAAESAAEEMGGVKVLARVLQDAGPRELRAMVDEAKKTLGSGVVALAGVRDGKASLAVGVTDDLTERCDAVALVRAGAAVLGGKGGGGRADMAQAGGPDASRVKEALEAVKREVGKKGGAA